MNLGPVVETRTYADVVDTADGEVLTLHSVYEPEPATGLLRSQLRFLVLMLRREGAEWFGVLPGRLVTGRLALCPVRRREVVS